MAAVATHNGIRPDEVVTINNAGEVLAFTDRYVQAVNMASYENGRVSEAVIRRDDFLGSLRTAGAGNLVDLMERTTDERFAQEVREHYQAPMIQINVTEMPESFFCAVKIPSPPTVVLHSSDQLEELCRINQPFELAGITELTLEFNITPQNVESVQGLLQQLPNLRSLKVQQVTAPIELNNDRLSDFCCKQVFRNITFRTPNLNSFSFEAIDARAKLIFDCIIGPDCTIMAERDIFGKTINETYGPIRFFLSDFNRVTQSRHKILQFLALRNTIFPAVANIGILFFNAAWAYCQMYPKHEKCYIAITGLLYVCALASALPLMLKLGQNVQLYKSYAIDFLIAAITATVAGAFCNEYLTKFRYYRVY